jgi:hypothetical protein
VPVRPSGKIGLDAAKWRVGKWKRWGDGRLTVGHVAEERAAFFVWTAAVCGSPKTLGGMHNNMLSGTAGVGYGLSICCRMEENRRKPRNT